VRVPDVIGSGLDLLACFPYCALLYWLRAQAGCGCHWQKRRSKLRHTLLLQSSNVLRHIKTCSNEFITCLKYLYLYDA